MLVPVHNHCCSIEKQLDDLPRKKYPHNYLMGAHSCGVGWCAASRIVAKIGRELLTKILTPFPLKQCWIYLLLCCCCFLFLWANNRSSLGSETVCNQITKACVKPRRRPTELCARVACRSEQNLTWCHDSKKRDLGPGWRPRASTSAKIWSSLALRLLRRREKKRKKEVIYCTPETQQ